MAVSADVIGDLVAAVGALCAADPGTLADGESVQALHRELDRLEAVATRGVAAFDAGRSWEADGACTAAAWISTRCHLPMPTARRRVRLGRELRHMPATEAAWLCGGLGEAHAAVLARTHSRATAEAFERDEKLLVDHAERFRFHQFARLCAYWRQRADPDGAEDDAKGQRELRRFHLSQSFEGCWFVDGCLDPISGVIVNGRLKAIDDELFAADWAEAKARVGDGVCVADLARSPAQRRADALVEMARRAGALPAGARLPEPLFSAFVGYETLAGPICELANGTVVSPGSLVPYLDEAWLERVVFDGPSRVMDIGVRQRLFSGATRRAVMLKDRECFDEYCDIPADECQIDHIEPYAAGGLTIQANGRPACGFHNRNRHRRS